LLPTVRRLQHLLSVPRYWPEVPLSDGFYESLGCDLVHFATQNFVLCAAPTIYNPHDLQHLHYPQFWTPADIAWRETMYPAGCRFARTVVVGSQWVKDDVVHQYQISPEKVQVIPEAPPTQWPPAPTAEFLTTVQHKYQLKQPFALYPAVTWPHKNHLRLLDALASLRDTWGLTLHLVCTGARQDFWPQIARRIDELNLGPQVTFLGFIPEAELRAVYRLAQCLVMPSLFEAISLPIFDAWAEGVPVICSHATALPEQVQDAAVLFDPHSVEAMAHAIAKVATSVEIQHRLKERGTQRVKDFNWERTAKAYRAVYRRAAQVALTEEDRWLLSWDWIRAPHKKREEC
jgi:glycosyltransferase involved in cell wall biosynthesis